MLFGASGLLGFPGIVSFFVLRMRWCLLLDFGFITFAALLVTRLNA